MRLAYHSASRDAETDRVVHPYTLAQRFGHWYLYGHDRQRERPLAFRLDRIRGCQVLPERFEPPGDAELGRMRLFSPSEESRCESGLRRKRPPGRSLGRASGS